MAGQNVDDVQKLLDHITELHRKLAEAGEVTRGVRRAIEPTWKGVQQELVVGADGKLDRDAWGRLSDELKASLYERLSGVADLLGATAEGDPGGPTDHGSVMYKEYASNGWVWGLLIGGILWTALLIWGVFRYWDEATKIVVDLANKTRTGPKESEVLRMIIIMGALGGSLHWTSSFAKYVGNGQLLRRWIPYYLLVPFEGAALAPVVYLLLRVGVLGGAVSNEGTGSLNLISLYGFAALTGLFSKQAIEMLYEVFKTIFTKIKGKDSLETTEAAGQRPAKPVAPAQPTGGKTP